MHGGGRSSANTTMKAFEYSHRHCLESYIVDATNIAVDYVMKYEEYATFRLEKVTGKRFVEGYE